MGTSMSRRSPSTPRFAAFVAALGSDVGTPRVVSEFYSAVAPGWGGELAGPGVAAIAAALHSSGEIWGDEVSTADSPGLVLSSIVAQARNVAIHQAGGSVAIALGERALARLLLKLQHEHMSASPEQGRGEELGIDRSDLTRRYLGEVVRQLALHVASRDAPQHVSAEGRAVQAARSVVREVAEAAAFAAADATRNLTFGSDTFYADWATAVTVVLNRGRKRPEIHGG